MKLGKGEAPSSHPAAAGCCLCSKVDTAVVHELTATDETMSCLGTAVGSQSSSAPSQPSPERARHGQYKKGTHKTRNEQEEQEEIEQQIFCK